MSLSRACVGDFLLARGCCQMYVCMSECMYACMHVCMYVCLCVCVRACVCGCVCVCVGGGGVERVGAEWSSGTEEWAITKEAYRDKSVVFFFF